MTRARFGIVAILVMVLTMAVSTSAAAGGGGKPNLASGFGKVPGRDLIVHVWVVVPPGANANEVADEAVRRQGARPIDSEEFATNGLVWDQFSDNDPGNDFVLVNYNSKGVPDNVSDERTTWLASEATWTAVPTSGFVFTDGGDTGRCPSLVRECKGPQKFDGNNDVGWLNIAEPGILGVTWFGTQTDEFDMVLDNENFTWYVGESTGIPSGAIDAETVWLHEFGHGLGLSHSAVEGAVMEPFYDGVRRAPHQDDVDGITFLYPTGTEVPTGTISGQVTSAADGSTIPGASVSVDTGESTTTASDGTYSIDVPTGARTVSASASGFQSQEKPADVTDGGTTTVDFALNEQQLATVTVDSIAYDTEGGKSGDKHLVISVTVRDDAGNPVSGANVSIDLYRDGPKVASGANVTGSNGTTGFTLKNARSGCYTTTVASVSAAGLAWDGAFPPNSFGLRVSC